MATPEEETCSTLMVVRLPGCLMGPLLGLLFVADCSSVPEDEITEFFFYLDGALIGFGLTRLYAMVGEGRRNTPANDEMYDCGTVDAFNRFYEEFEETIEAH